MSNLDFRMICGSLNHPKVIRLRRVLGEAGPLGWIGLLDHTARYHPSGDLSGIPVGDIEIAAGWNGSEGKLVEELLRVRLLDRGPDGGLFVHDWIEHNPWAAGASERSEHARKAARKKHAQPDNGHAQPDNGHAQSDNGHAQSDNGHAQSDNGHAQSDNGHAPSLALPSPRPSESSPTPTPEQNELLISKNPSVQRPTGIVLEVPVHPASSCLAENSWETFRRIWTPALRNGKFIDEDSCREKWTLTPAMWNQWIAAAKNYVISQTVKDGFAMNPMKFLSRAWTDWQEPETPSGADAQGPRPADRDGEQEILEREEYQRQVEAGKINPGIPVPLWKMEEALK